MYPYEYRRRLPHFQPDYKIFFITFCTDQRWTLPPAARKIVVDTCLAGNGQKFDLYGLVVMPDHVHLALVPLCPPQGPIPIAEIMQAIKGASAHRINRLLNRRGQVWQEESFDRALRKEEQFEAKLYTCSRIQCAPASSAIHSTIPGSGEEQGRRLSVSDSMEGWASPVQPGEDARRSMSFTVTPAARRLLQCRRLPAP